MKSFVWIWETTICYHNKSYKMAKVVKRSSMLGVFNLLHPSHYKRWRATLIALMSSTECSQPSHNEICSRRNRPERLGRTLRHMAKTAVISMAGGSMLQIGKRLSHPGLWPWWRVLEKDSPESSTQSRIFSLHWGFCQKADLLCTQCHQAFMWHHDTANQVEWYLILFCLTFSGTLVWYMWLTLFYVKQGIKLINSLHCPKSLFVSCITYKSTCWDPCLGRCTNLWSTLQRNRKSNPVLLINL